ncbi:MAG TPA: tetratricopeptide repeat protein [Candidatus Thermoplasmatota archaeon]|nr:tetratricopeptide repeat protein [Candidatus Thermoplasmatota archaeon]
MRRGLLLVAFVLAISTTVLAEDDAFEAAMRNAEAKYLAGEYGAAVSAYEAALKVRPRDPTAKAGLAAARGYVMRAEAQELAKAGRHKEAIALLEKSKKVDKAGAKFADESITWVRRLQDAKKESGKFEGMKAAFDAGNTYLAEGKAPQAEAAFRAALAFDTKQPAIHQGLGNALALQSRYPEAERAYADALALAPKDATLQYLVGVALAGQGRAAEAEAAYRRAIELDPKAVLARNNLATLLRAEGRLDEAEAEYRAALALAPDDPMLTQNLELLVQERAALTATETPEAATAP